MEPDNRRDKEKDATEIDQSGRGEEMCGPVASRAAPARFCINLWIVSETHFLSGLFSFRSVLGILLRSVLKILFGAS